MKKGGILSSLSMKQRFIILAGLMIGVPIIILNLLSFQATNNELMYKENEQLSNHAFQVFAIVQEIHNMETLYMDSDDKLAMDSLSRMIVNTNTEIDTIIISQAGGVVFPPLEQLPDFVVQGGFLDELEELGKDKSPGIITVKEMEKYVAASIVTEDPRWTIISIKEDYSFEQGLERLQGTSIVIGVISIMLAMGLIYFFIDKFTHPLGQITKAFERMADQDYSQNVQIDSSDDEVRRLTSAYYMMINNTRNVVNSIKENMQEVSRISESLSSSSEEVNASTQQVGSTIQDMARATEKQSRIVEESSEAILELNKSIDEIAGKLHQAGESTKRATMNAQNGRTAAAQASEKMQHIKKTVTHANSNIAELGEKSEKIGEIITVIKGISVQTNLLALNAAIEAARAGEAGKGFAVVSEEIRKLADQSKKATEEIAELIISMQEATEASIKSMKEGIEGVDDGSQVIGNALVALEGIGAIIERIHVQVNQTIEDSGKQSLLTEKVNKAIAEASMIAEQTASGGEEVSASVEETTSAMEEVASNAQQLSKAAESLQHVINKFKMD